MNLRALAMAFVLALPAGLSLSPSPAAASVSILVSLDQMVNESACVVVATAGDRHSVWEDSSMGRHIVTYTKLTIERAVVGAPGTEVWVRTLGGQVGDIGQAVSGEAQLATGARALLFLTKDDSAYVVTAMAQGHYRLVTDDKTKALRLVSSPDTGALLPRNGPTISARERLLGVSLDDAIVAIQKVRRGANEKK